MAPFTFIEKQAFQEVMEVFYNFPIFLFVHIYLHKCFRGTIKQCAQYFQSILKTVKD